MKKNIHRALFPGAMSWLAMNPPPVPPIFRQQRSTHSTTGNEQNQYFNPCHQHGTHFLPCKTYVIFLSMPSDLDAQITLHGFLDTHMIAVHLFIRQGSIHRAVGACIGHAFPARAYVFTLEYIK